MKRCPSCQGRYRDGAAHCPFDGAALVVLEDPLIGRLIGGRYVIEAKLGSGAVASVYRGRHQALDREVALKVLHAKLAAQEEHRQRFLREARAANRVHHANVVDIVDIGETEDGIVYLVMEYLRGVTLASEIDRGALPLARACAIGQQIAAALARAHVLGVVHRDVKPDNVFLLQGEGQVDLVKLLDFGLAHAPGEAELGKSKGLFGTPGYMAPEQIEGGPVGPAADLYALGCLLYEMLTGVLPFEGSVPSLVYQHVHAEVPSLRARRPELPQALDALVAKLMAKSAARRPASAYQVAAALSALLGSPPPPPPPPADGRAASAPPPPSGAAAPAPSRGEDRLWEGQLAQLHARASALHAGHTLPLWLRQTFSRMDELLEQVRSGRGALVEQGRAAGWSSERAREAAMRIGQALDTLASQELALAERFADAEQRLSRAYRALEPHAEGLLAAVERLESAPDARLDPQQRSLPSLLRDWAKAQRVAVDLERECEAVEREREDLGFQVAQLKGRLGAVDALSDAENQESAERESALDAALRAKIYALRLDADRISEHLLERESAPAPAGG